MAININVDNLTNITEYPNTFKRQGAFPLDKTSMFNNLSAAQAYATGSSIAYVGQVISVADTSGATPSYDLYIITSDTTTPLLKIAKNVDVTTLEAKVNAMSNLKFEKCNTLPTENISYTTIYLVSKTPLTTQNAYDEYIRIKGEDGASDSWEKIGSTDIDLSGYVTTESLTSTLAGYSTATNIKNGTANYSTTEGYFTTASGNASHAEGYMTTAKGNYQHVQGKYNIVDNENKYTHIVGGGITDSDRKNIHTLDWSGNGWFAGDVEANVDSVSHKLSEKSNVDHTHSEYSTATNVKNGTGQSSVTEGSVTVASGANSHAEGYFTTASGAHSHSEGWNTTASGQNSHAEGEYTTASGAHSHVEGYSTTAKGNYQHVQGFYNIVDNENKYAHIVGNGDEDEGIPANIHTLDWDGNGWYSGTVECTGIILKSTNKRFKLTVDDQGGLHTTEITEE